MLDLDPNRPVATPRPAATVLVLRDDTAELAVYVIVRHPKSGFMGGVVAFPGGKVDAADDEPSLHALLTPLSPRFAAFGDDLPASANALAVAAVRECLEEAAMLPVEAPDLTDDEARALRARVEAGAGLHDELRGLGRKVDLGALVPFARWVTPVAEPRRFDACFFLLRRPAGQEGAFDPHETTAGEWATPHALLARFDRGEVMIAPPTLRCLELLATCATVDEALALAERQNLRPVCPHLARVDDVPALVLPGDPLHPERATIVEGPSRFVLRDGRFRGELAPREALPSSDEPPTGRSVVGAVGDRSREGRGLVARPRPGRGERVLDAVGRTFGRRRLLRHDRRRSHRVARAPHHVAGLSGRHEFGERERPLEAAAGRVHQRPRSPVLPRRAPAPPVPRPRLRPPCGRDRRRPRRFRVPVRVGRVPVRDGPRGGEQARATPRVVARALLRALISLHGRPAARSRSRRPASVGTPRCGAAPPRSGSR